MRATSLKNLTSVAIAALTLSSVGLAGASAGAASTHATMYACKTKSVISRVSVAPHACPRGATKYVRPFAGANLTGVNLVGANLAGAVMARTTLNKVVVWGAITGQPASLPANWTVAGGYLMGPTANLSGATLLNLDLTGANLSSANLSGVASAGLTGQPSALPVNWRLVAGYLVGPSANLSGVDLTAADLSSANLSGANFYGATLTQTNFTNANLKGASISGATLTDAVFTGATLTGIISAYEVGYPAALPDKWHIMNGPYQGMTVEYLVGPGASIGGAHLPGLSFAHLDLTGIYMPGSELVGTDFTGATLVNASMGSSNFGHALFVGANLTGADFTAADLSGADFTNANFTNANLIGARLLSVAGHGTATFTGAMCPDGVKYGQPGANC